LAQALILDAEALNALAWASRRSVLADRARAILTVAYEGARRAGALLERAKLSSTQAVDAFVVATAMAFASAVIVTHDPEDLARLASGARHIRIFEI
jgi:hypothetical protein